MVVGDRLWLFSQTPAGPTPVQSMMLNSPISIPSMHTNLHTNPALLARGQGINYGIAKPPSFPSIPAPLSGRLQPQYKAYDSFLATKYNHQQPPSLSQRNLDYSKSQIFAKFNGLNASIYKNGPSDPDAYLQMKYAPPNGAFDLPATSATSNGIAELERVFGDRNQLLELSCNEKTKMERNATKHEINKNDSDDQSSSEIDCEEIDDENNI